MVDITDASLFTGFQSKRGAGTLSLSGGRGITEYPRWVKYTGNPILTLPEQASPSFYWPDIMDMSQTTMTLPDGHRWLLVYSTDHGDTGAGAYWATAPDPFGKWTPRGRFYANYETPTLIWDETRNVLNIYMHGNRTGQGAIGVQTTFMVTTTDMVNFTLIGNMVDIPDQTMFPGDGHTGYFMPYKYNGLWFAMHLLGGTSASRGAVAYSIDGGRTWRDDPRQLGYNKHLTNGNDENLALSGAAIFLWRGELWCVANRGTSSAGGSSVGTTQYAARVRDDLRGFADNPIPLNIPAQAWEGDYPGGPHRIFNYKGTLAAVYRGGGNTANAAIGLLTLEN